MSDKRRGAILGFLCVSLWLGSSSSALPGAEGGGPPADTVSAGRLFAVNGTELWVRRVGAGEPAVVVHGGPLLEHGYLVEHLEPLARDYELIFFDQRLSGRSAAEVEEGSVSLVNFAEDIEALRVALGPDRIHLVGHSWGGLLAMQYAILHPEHLASLTLLNPMAASSALWQQEQQALGSLSSEGDASKRQQIMATEAFAARRPEAIEQLLRLSFEPQFKDRSRVEDLDLFVPEDYAERSQRFAALGPDLESFDLHDALTGLDVSALILYGDSEVGATLGGPAIHEALRGSKFVLVENAGHFPFIEQPEVFMTTVRDFLSGRLD